MIKQIVTIDHKKYATGLFWQPVTAGVNPYLYARQLVEKVNKKYNLFVEYQSMIGLGDSHNGFRAGMPSVAALVASSLSGFISFLGVFQTGSNFYLIAVRNAVIIHDVLFETETEARKLYAELSNIPDWGALFAPASWGMPRSQEKFLSDFVARGTIVKLRQISMAKSVGVSVVIGGVFLVLLGLFLYSPVLKMFEPKKTTQLNPTLLAEYQRQLEAKNKQLDKEFEIVKKEKIPLDYPYNHLPDVMERANLCYKAIAFVMQPVMGWSQKNTRCESEYAFVDFSRGFGTLNDFYAIGGDLFPGGIVEQVSNNEMKVRIKLPELEKFASIDERDQVTAMRDITSIFQQVKVNANVKVANQTLKNEDFEEKINVIEVTVSSKLIPTEFMQFFADFDGVYMKSVKWNVGARSWDYDVLVYTK